MINIVELILLLYILFNLLNSLILFLNKWYEGRLCIGIIFLVVNEYLFFIGWVECVEEDLWLFLIVIYFGLWVVWFGWIG